MQALILSFKITAVISRCLLSCLFHWDSAMKDLALWLPGSSQPARLNHTRNIQACFFFEKDCSWPVRTFGILNWEAHLFSDHRAARLIINLLWHIYSKFPFSSYFLSQAASPFVCPFLWLRYSLCWLCRSSLSSCHHCFFCGGGGVVCFLCQCRIVFFINRQMISCICTWLLSSLIRTHAFRLPPNVF